MDIAAELDRIHLQVKENRWFRYFTVFNRLALAVGFVLAGVVKILGERFASGLSSNHPMGHYLEALFHTGYYYTFIGIVQVLAAVLLLLPRTATLGALLYFPIIVNICVLSFAVRFEGSLISSPLMVLANLYLLCWDYDKLKFMLPFGRPGFAGALPQQKNLAANFPLKFFGGAAATVVGLVLVITNVYQIMPRNSFSDCKKQFIGTRRTKAGSTFCDCIHNQGKPLANCLDEYNEAPDDIAQASAR